MNKTKIEWGDRTWNPVTGCRHGCDYCYARGIVKRFQGQDYNDGRMLRELDAPCNYTAKSGKHILNPYPFGFVPTLHRYRLGEPKTAKTPQNIFVCSMADLFGDWVPDGWIQSVFAACWLATRHRYLFLTKNPERYRSLWAAGKLPKEFWYGHTITTEGVAAHAQTWKPTGYNNFLSIEPLQGDAEKGNWLHLYKWVIVGAESGNRKGRVIPKREWVENIVAACRDSGIPVFLKNSLAKIWGEPPIQEFPWKSEVTQ